ncbi:hypothetical protein F5Y16DRAFT_404176 [Xylariaceae sp. FL0255]|nr:hypothetical protein F5Y16DRAFT_404176 [Xylariaceae sp. FL0255]
MSQMPSRPKTMESLEDNMILIMVRRLDDYEDTDVDAHLLDRFDDFEYELSLAITFEDDDSGEIYARLYSMPREGEFLDDGDGQVIKLNMEPGELPDLDRFMIFFMLQEDAYTGEVIEVVENSIKLVPGQSDSREWMHDVFCEGLKEGPNFDVIDTAIKQTLFQIVLREEHECTDGRYLSGEDVLRTESDTAYIDWIFKRQEWRLFLHNPPGGRQQGQGAATSRHWSEY